MPTQQNKTLYYYKNKKCRMLTVSRGEVMINNSTRPRVFPSEQPWYLPNFGSGYGATFTRLGTPSAVVWAVSLICVWISSSFFKTYWSREESRPISPVFIWDKKIKRESFPLSVLRETVWIDGESRLGFFLFSYLGGMSIQFRRIH